MEKVSRPVIGREVSAHTYMIPVHLHSNAVVAMTIPVPCPQITAAVVQQYLEQPNCHLHHQPEPHLPQNRPMFAGETIEVPVRTKTWIVRPTGTAAHNTIAVARRQQTIVAAKIEFLQETSPMVTRHVIGREVSAHT